MFLLLAVGHWRRVFIVVIVVLYRYGVVMLEDFRIATVALFKCEVRA
jgi:hypothetical protein